MSGKARPSLRKKALYVVKQSDFSKAVKECIAEVFERYESMIEKSAKSVAMSMTEAEIMKALEDQKGVFLANGVFVRDALDLINRKNAENEEMSMEIDELIIAKDQLFDEADALIKKAKTEAIKYFAGIVKFKTDEKILYGKGAICRILDQIAKEMGVEL